MGPSGMQMVRLTVFVDEPGHYLLPGLGHAARTSIRWPETSAQGRLGPTSLAGLSAVLVWSCSPCPALTSTSSSNKLSLADSLRVTGSKGPRGRSVDHIDRQQPSPLRTPP